jgi:hypothetical protein
MSTNTDGISSRSKDGETLSSKPDGMRRQQDGLQTVSESPQYTAHQVKPARKPSESRAEIEARNVILPRTPKFGDIIAEPARPDDDFEFTMSDTSSDESENKLNEKYYIEAYTKASHNLVEMSKLFMNLLVSLSKNPEMDYIKWPDRLPKIKDIMERVTALKKV